MKKYLIILILTLCCLPSYTFADCQIRVRVSDFIPQYYQDKQGTWKGLAVEYAEALLREANCTPVFIKTPWKRALTLMKAGKIDLMLNLSISEERQQYMYFIGPQRDETMVLVVRKESEFDIHSLEDIKKLPGKIGMELGNYFGEEFDNKFRNDPEFTAKFEEVHDTALNINKLLYRRIVGFISERYNAVYKMKIDSNYKYFKINPFVVNQDYVYFALSKVSISEELLIQLNSAYEAARRKGTFDEILDRYQ